MEMKTITKALGFIVCLVCYIPVMAVDVREIDWEELIPPRNFDDPFEAMTDDHLYALSMIEWTRETYNTAPSMVTKEMLDRADALEKELDQQGIDVDELLTQRDEIEEQWKAQGYLLVEELNGKNVRMPGYVLPIEFDDQKVTEFFLVPYVGACIHVPPPPPNQMVYVTSAEAIEAEGLYDPVWVEGTISTTGKNSPWNSFDGVFEISAGYTMQADVIEPY